MASILKKIKRRNSMFVKTEDRNTSMHQDPRRASEPFALTCKPCLDAGSRTEAAKYCGQCHIYMCNECVQGHNAKSKRSHSMPEGKKIHNNIHYGCAKHKSKVIKYFCMNHNVLGCSDCVSNSHKSCAQLKYIPEMIEHTDICEVTGEYDENIENLNNALKHAQKNKSGLNEKEKIIEETSEKAVKKVRDLRKQMNELFDIIEDEVETQAKNLRDEDIKKVKEQSQEYDYITANIENLITELENKYKEDQSHELFVAMKTTETNTELIKEKLAELEEDNLISNYDFVPERDVRRLLSGKAKLGSIQKDRDATYVVDMNVRTTKDKATCWVSGIVALSSDYLVIADHENSCIKLVNTSINKIKARLETSSSPWDITKIDNNFLALTLPDERKIQIVKVKSKLTVSCFLQLDAECCGIQYVDKKLFVTVTNPPKVQVLDLQGNVLRTIAKDKRGNPLFSNPFNIATSPDQKHIYVSDVNEHSVTCLTIDGKLVNTYKSFSLTGPMGLAVDKFGNVYTCGGWSNTIHRLKSDCSNGKDILRNMSEPQSITFSEDQKHFYVGKLASNKISVYEID